jgi:hypothetical protein
MVSPIYPTDLDSVILFGVICKSMKLPWLTGAILSLDSVFDWGR